MKERKVDHWVKPFLKKYRLAMIIALILGCLTVICASSLMFNSGYLISKAATKPENILIIYVPIVLTRAFGIGRPVFRYFEQLTSHNWVLKMVSGLRKKLYNLLEKDAIFLDKHHKIGDLIGILVDDIDHLQNLYLMVIFPNVIAWIIYFIILICLGLFSWWITLMIGLILLVFLIIFPLVSVIVNGYKQEKQKVLTSNLYNQLTDNILGVSDWIFSQRSDDYLNDYKSTQEELTNLKNKIDHFKGIRKLLFQVVTLFIVLIIVIWSAYQFGGQEELRNWIAAFVLCIFPLMDTFRPLGEAAEQGRSYQESIDRLNNLSEDKIDDGNKANANIESPYNLEIKNVTFSYDNKYNVLDNINLSIKQNEKIAILGKSGSGKSTLLSLVRGDLIPNEGSIYLNGYDIHNIKNISQYIGVIDQSPYLFNTSILNNIRLGNESATDDDVLKVIEKVNLQDLINELPNGLYTNMEEAGQRFSGGERQRIALARILLKKPKIMILDEPTVGLDPITEQALLNTFFDDLKDVTVIWVTHHLQGIQSVDRVVFIEDGHKIIDDSPCKLSETNDYYCKLRKMDMGI